MSSDPLKASSKYPSHPPPPGGWENNSQIWPIGNAAAAAAAASNLPWPLKIIYFVAFSAHKTLGG